MSWGWTGTWVCRTTRNNNGSSFVAFLPYSVRLAWAPCPAKQAISPPMLPESLILLLRSQKKRSVQTSVEKKNPGFLLPKKKRAVLNSGSDTEKPCLSVPAHDDCLRTCWKVFWLILTAVITYPGRNTLKLPRASFLEASRPSSLLLTIH